MMSKVGPQISHCYVTSQAQKLSIIDGSEPVGACILFADFIPPLLKDGINKFSSVRSEIYIWIDDKSI